MTAAVAWRTPAFLLLFALACTSRVEEGQRPGARAAQEKLRAELLAMGDADQAWIEASLSPSANRQKSATDYLRRVQRLKEIVQQYGWPTISLVGSDGASAAWLVAQHADVDPEFQRSCVPLIEAAASKGEARLTHMACLTDRALTATGEPQFYGTQGIGGTVVERRAIDERRKAIGLPSLEAYWKSLQDGTGVTTCRR